MGRSSLIIVLFMVYVILFVPEVSSAATQTISSGTCSNQTTEKLVGYDVNGNPICAADQTGQTNIESAFAMYVDAISGADTPDCADDFDPNNPDFTKIEDCCGPINKPCRTVNMTLEIISHTRDNGAKVCDGNVDIICSEVVSNPDPVNGGCTGGTCTFTGNKCSSDYWAGTRQSCQPNQSVCDAASAGACSPIVGPVTKVYKIYLSRDVHKGNIIFPPPGFVSLISTGGANILSTTGTRHGVIIHDTDQALLKGVGVNNAWSGGGAAILFDQNNKAGGVKEAELSYNEGPALWLRGQGNVTVGAYSVITFAKGVTAIPQSIIYESWPAASVCISAPVVGESLANGSASNVDPTAASPHPILGGRVHGTLTDPDLVGKSIKPGDRVMITSGTGVDQHRYIVEFDSSSGTITVDWPWYDGGIPDSTSVYRIMSDPLDKLCDDDTDCGANEICWGGYDSIRTRTAAPSSADIGILDNSFLQGGDAQDGAVFEWHARAGGANFNNFVGGNLWISPLGSNNTTDVGGVWLKDFSPQDCRTGTCVPLVNSMIVSFNAGTIGQNLGAGTGAADYSLRVDSGLVAQVYDFTYDACKRQINGTIRYKHSASGGENYGGSQYLGYLECDAPPNPQPGEIWYDAVNGHMEFYSPLMKIGQGSNGEILFDTSLATNDPVLKGVQLASPIFDFTHSGDTASSPATVSLLLRGKTFASIAEGEDIPALTGANRVVAKTADYTLSGDNRDVGCTVFTNDGATGAVTFTLPPIEDADDLGYCASFFAADAQTIYVDPDSTDQIAVLTDALGDRAQSSGSKGDMLTLMAITVDEWAVVGQNGTWTDAN